MKLILLTLALWSVCFSTQASPLKDGQETNGGDPFVAEFLMTLDSALDLLPLTMPLENGAILNQRTLEAARNSVAVSSVQSLTFEGREVAAINRPYTTPPTIVMSRSAWKLMSENQKTLLVLHEILPIAHIYDADYRNSAALAQIVFNNTPISFKSLTANIKDCDTLAIEVLSQDKFKRMITPHQSQDLMFLALDYKCPAFLKKLAEWKYNMDICVGSQSTLNWFLNTNLNRHDASLEILQIMTDQGSPTKKLCGGKLNDSCALLSKCSKEFRESASPILNCSF